ncbi:hypothetical protein [Lacticaseibacillus parakribbianus]|uniref:hypothetical protein n=1 Tax=Lacticaseibacillus parakribbianus TaxID=2970927 RepID=UPI0021CB1163|nr:hypothetical protein [Lacticaseibacillus parakribbianus]
MKKFWLAIAALWVLSIVYFLVYVNAPALQTAVDQSAGLSLLHGIMDILLLGGGFALIARGLYRLFHR